MKTLLELSREMAAMAQAGLTYSRDPFDRDRFARLREVAAEVLQTSGVPDFAWPEERGYTTPKVDVRGAVFQGDSVLLIREASSGLWTLPGGWADVNFTPAENVERECREETGYEVRATALTSALDRDRAGYPANAHSIYKMTFLCEITGGAPALSVESTEIGFFPLSALPELDAHRIRREEIEHAYAMHRGEAAATLFN